MYLSIDQSIYLSFNINIYTSFNRSIYLSQSIHLERQSYSRQLPNCNDRLLFTFARDAMRMGSLASIVADPKSLPNQRAPTKLAIPRAPANIFIPAEAAEKGISFSNSIDGKGAEVGFPPLLILEVEADPEVTKS